MTINRKILTKAQSNNPNRLLRSIDYITIHCTGNYAATAGAANHATFVFNGSGGGEASFHYVVDDKEIWQMFEDNQVCWHCGDGGNGTGNTTSIGIEICVNERANFRQACENAAWLVGELMSRHKLTIERVVQHNRWSGKNCPNELRSGAWGVTWVQFIDMVKAETKKSSNRHVVHYACINQGQVSHITHGDNGVHTPKQQVVQSSHRGSIHRVGRGVRNQGRHSHVPVGDRNRLVQV